MTDPKDYLEIVPSKVPWPEWPVCADDEEGKHERLLEDNGRWYIMRGYYHEGGWKDSWGASAWGFAAHAALCILRNAVREWLDTQGISVWFDCPGMYLFSDCQKYQRTYDDALIAAVKAASEEDQ